MGAQPSSGHLLLGQAATAMQGGDFATALGLLTQAEMNEPGNPEIHMAKAVVLRVKGEHLQAIAALDDALALDPYHFFALLSKGAIIERLSGQKAASRIYRTALKLAPSAEHMPPAMAAQTEHARRVVEADQAALEAFLNEQLTASSALGEAQAFRFRESVDIMLGKARPFVQEPLLFHYAQLPPVTFYPRDMFPWFAELEAATDTIRAELEMAISILGNEFRPYIQYPSGAPVNQWAELNHSEKWNTLFLWRDGVRQDEACQACPQTAALLERLPMSRQPGFAPTAMFSRLDARTRIPPHTGSTNVRLITHLPLILPGPAAFRVGNETRSWKMGEAWVFDDTIEHEAWNDADQERVILIFDVWNPFLGEAERDLVSQLMISKNAFYAS